MIRVAKCSFAEVKQFAARAAKERVSISDTANTEWHAAWEGDRILGCAALLVAGQKARIKGCWTEPVDRGKGAGNALVLHLISKASDNPALNRIEVLSVAPAFWRKLGFKELTEVRSGVTRLTKHL